MTIYHTWCQWIPCILIHWLKDISLPCVSSSSLEVCIGVTGEAFPLVLAKYPRINHSSNDSWIDCCIAKIAITLLASISHIVAAQIPEWEWQIFLSCLAEHWWWWKRQGENSRWSCRSSSRRLLLKESCSEPNHPIFETVLPPKAASSPPSFLSVSSMEWIASVQKLMEGEIRQGTVQLTSQLSLKAYSCWVKVTNQCFFASDFHAVWSLGWIMKMGQVWEDNHFAGVVDAVLQINKFFPTKLFLNFYFLLIKSTVFLCVINFYFSVCSQDHPNSFSQFLVQPCCPLPSLSLSVLLCLCT